MDWKKITDSVAPYIDKAKEYGQKAATFTEEQIQMTPLFIKTKDEYDELITKKRVIILGYDENNIDIARDIRLYSSVWLTYAVVDVATLKFVNLTEYSELAAYMGLTGPVDMMIRYEGEEVARYRDIPSIKSWWNNRVYLSGVAPVTSEVETTPIDTASPPVDPLSKI